jgi:beta-glucanase (GH16 family)
MKRIFLIFSTACLLVISCGGGSSTDDIIETPSNLTIEFNCVGSNASNPDGDGSGTVIFNFSAANASFYKLNLGNGDIVETSSTTLTYTYTGTGTNTYDVYISAYNADTFISTSITVKVKIDLKLIWSDEFDGSGAPDSDKWGYDIGTGSNGWGNGESQYYTDRSENVKRVNGFLIITAKAESYEGSEYTSSRLLTQGKFDFTYGRVEVKAKLPSGGGTWPAIWMLGADFSSVGWPACGETDIMEHAGNRQGIVQSAMHTSSSYGNTVNHGSQTLSDVSTEFHVYTVEWTSEKMVFSVDDKVHYTYNPSTKNSETWPFDKDQFIILNVAMGGGFGGDIDPNFVQSSMEIDYVRVYQ